MLIALTVAGISGLVLGFYGRAAAIALTSIAVFCLAVPLSILAEWSLGSGILMTFGLLTAMQLGFLIGLYISTNSLRLRKSFRQLYVPYFAKHEMSQTNTAD